MQKKKSPPVKDSSSSKKGTKKEKKFSGRKITIFSLLVLLVLVTSGIHVYVTQAPGNEHFFEYSGGCFLRSYSGGTGRNTSQTYELIPSEVVASSLLTIKISPSEYENLGGDIHLPSSTYVCQKNISLSYSMERHKVEKLKIQ